MDETISMWCPDCDGTGLISPAPLLAAHEQRADPLADVLPLRWAVDCRTCSGQARLTVVLVVAEPDRP
jgi:hypothetical protein